MHAKELLVSEVLPLRPLTPEPTPSDVQNHT